MRLLSWNCQGLGNPRTVQDLDHLVKVNKPNIILLMKTRLRKSKMDRIKYVLGYQCLFSTVEGVGQDEGLALMWKEDFNLHIYSYSQRHQLMGDLVRL